MAVAPGALRQGLETLCPRRGGKCALRAHGPCSLALPHLHPPLKTPAVIFSDVPGPAQDPLCISRGFELPWPRQVHFLRLIHEGVSSWTYTGRDHRPGGFSGEVGGAVALTAAGTPRAEGRAGDIF